MNDKELADRVVALGVGTKRVDQDYYDWSNAWTDAWQKDRMCKTKPAAFVRDWRVAGALIEKCYAKNIDVGIDSPTCTVEAIFDTEGFPCTSAAINESLPRAIIEACVEALT